MTHHAVKPVIGDHPNIKKELKGYNHRLTLKQAQHLLKLICRYKRWERYELKYSNKKCIKVYAWCDVQNKVILIHKIPETVQLIIHEITHIREPEHTEKFKKIQLNLINLYKTKFHKIIFKEE